MQRRALAVARNLITTMPASLRVRCPGYPGFDDPEALQAAAVALATRIRDELKIAKRCGDVDALKVGRKGLFAMGFTGARHLLRPPKD